MSTETIGLLGIIALLTLIFLRVPVGIAMGIVGFFGYASVDGFDRALRVLGQTPYDIASGYTLSVVPLFILMGELAMRSGMSAKLYTSARSMFLGVRGSQALATIAACAGFGAICGSSLATAATMTRIAIPEMRRAKYDDSLSAGSVASGGSLGILIPPSIPLVVYGLIAEQSVPRLFAGSLVPGLLLTILYMAVALVWVMFKPNIAPQAESDSGWSERLKNIVSAWHVMLLFAVTIGGLYAGWFTPTEAAAVGAGGALILGLAFGQLTWKGVLVSFVETVRTTCMLFVIVIFAVTFSYFVTQAQLPQAVAAWMQTLKLGHVSLIVVLTIFYIVLGCFMDGFGMILITVPVFLPVLVQNGYDPIWFGVMLVIVIELGLIHPPVGMNIFVIQAQVPEIPITRIYKGIVPFLIAPLALLALLVAIPEIVMWLPHKLFN
ncbi:MAG TPA: TRAP transporter large permease [Bradyrhizobium sp.]|nr:TRAP transporter large permease [Bradyrhizobium sp.]